MDEQLGSKKVRWEARTSDPELHCASESDRVGLFLKRGTVDSHILHRIAGVFGHLLSAVRIIRFLPFLTPIVWHGRGRIGCAYYDSINCRLYVMEDSQDSVHYDLMHVGKQAWFISSL